MTDMHCPIIFFDCQFVARWACAPVGDRHIPSSTLSSSPCIKSRWQQLIFLKKLYRKHANLTPFLVLFFFKNLNMWPRLLSNEIELKVYSFFQEREAELYRRRYGPGSRYGLILSRLQSIPIIKRKRLDNVFPNFRRPYYLIYPSQHNSPPVIIV